MYKSKFEATLANLLKGRAEYEPDVLAYIQPAKKRKYIPDWKIGDNIYIESKGKFTADDRNKMLWVKEQHPDCTFYMLFQNARNKIRKGSPTSYSDWCDKHGIEWADFREGIPDKWFKGETIVHKASSKNGRRNSGVQRQSRRKGSGVSS